MNPYSEHLNCDVQMDKLSTEISSKSFSGLSGQKGHEINKNKFINYGSAEVCGIAIIAKRSNATTAQLSAQVMNLPYNQYNKTISNQTSGNSAKLFFDQLDIFKRIKDAYDACSCTICKCLTTNNMAPRAEYCDCEPCKCSDCTQYNRKSNAYKIQSNLDGKKDTMLKTLDILKRYEKNTTCDCKPCDCLECVRNGLSSKSNYYDRNKRTTTGNMIPKKQYLVRTEYPWRDSFDKRPFRHMTVYQSHPNRKCGTCTCECISCECKGNAITRNTPIRYGAMNTRLKSTNLGVCEFETCECHICSHKNQFDTQVFGCSTPKCTEGKRGLNKFESDKTNGSGKKCNCAPCECNDCILKVNDCDGRIRKANNLVYTLKNKHSIDRLIHENPGTYECREYSKMIQSRAEASTKARNALKYTHTHNKLQESSKTNTKAYEVDIPISMGNIKQVMENKKRKRKLLTFDEVSTEKTTSPRRNSHITKSIFDDGAVSLYSANLRILENASLNNERNTRFLSFSSDCFTWQEISKSSSNASYKNKGCSTRTISLPDTNIVEDFKETLSNSNLTGDRKYVRTNFTKQHSVYQCGYIKPDLSQKRYSTPTRMRENNCIEKVIVGNLLFDHFNQYFSEDAYVGRSEKVDYDGVRKTLRKAKQFSNSLNMVLQTYEKANSEFKNVSHVLKKTHPLILNGLNKRDGNTILKQAAAVEEIVQSSKLLKTNKNDAKPVQEVNLAKITKDIGNKNIQVEPMSIVKTVKEIKNRDEGQEPHNSTKLCIVESDELPENVKKMELLREKKIRNILKQNLVADPFTEQYNV